MGVIKFYLKTIGVVVAVCLVISLMLMLLSSVFGGIYSFALGYWQRLHFPVLLFLIWLNPSPVFETFWGIFATFIEWISFGILIGTVLKMVSLVKRNIRSKPE